jgi:hypothetical protein
MSEFTKKRKLDNDILSEDVMSFENNNNERQQAMQERIQFENERLSQLYRLNEEEQELQLKERELLYRKNLNDYPSSTTTVVTTTAAAKQLLLMQNVDCQVRMNVGGQVFVTTTQTINSCENLLRVMLNTDIPLEKDDLDGAIVFPDQNPEYFPVIMDYLQAAGDISKVCIDEQDLSSDQLQQLTHEAEFFGTVKLAKKIQSILVDRSLADSQLENQQQVTQKQEEAAEEEANKHSQMSQKYSQKSKELDEEWIQSFKQLTISQKEQESKYFASKNDEIKKKLAQVEHDKNQLKPSNEITLSLRGRQFVVPLETFVKYPDSIFNEILTNIEWNNSHVLFIDRDADNFSYLLQYMMTGKFDHFPNNPYRLKRIKRDANYYNLKELVNTFFNKFRYPLESIGHNNIQMKVKEDILRKMFATDRDNVLLNDPYILLLPIFDAPKSELEPDEETQNIPRLFDFTDYSQFRAYHHTQQHRDIPKPKLCANMETFLEQWDAFTYGMTEGLDWSNLFAAGGSVLACATHMDCFDNAEDPQAAKVANDDENKHLTTIDEDILADSDSENNESIQSEDVFSDLSQGESKMRNHFSATNYSSNNQTAQNRVTIRTPETIAQQFQRGSFASSDIDFFLYALSEEEAEKKIQHMYSVFKKNLEAGVPDKYGYGKYNQTTYQGMFGFGNNTTVSTPTDQQKDPESTDIFLLRTKSAITFHFKYPIRSIQVVLRIYKSPAEVLIGFDLDSVAIGFDGVNLWSSGRCRRAIANRVNLIDVDRQSTTYEIRLFKYAKRGFRVAVPQYHPSKVKNGELQICEPYYSRGRRSRSYATVRSGKELYNTYFGLARLLLLEKSLGLKEYWGLTGIGLNRNITSSKASYNKIKPPPFMVQKHIELDKNKDYAQIHIGYSRSNSPQSVFNQFNRCISFFKQLHRERLDNPTWEPQFVHSLNSIDTILQDKIAWVTLDAGRQCIGSFCPTDRNFFKDAYSPSAVERHNAISQKKDATWRKIYRVMYRIEQRRMQTRYLDKETNHRLEVGYRNYIKNNEDRYTSLSESQQVDWQKFEVVDKNQQTGTLGYYNYWRTKNLYRSKVYISAEKKLDFDPSYLGESQVNNNSTQDDMEE